MYASATQHSRLPIVAAAPPPEPPPVTGVLSTSFTLTTSAVNGTYPFTVGLAFKKGDATSIVTNLTNYQVSSKRTWSDGSLKHAIVSGRATLVQNVPLTVQVTNGTPPTGTALTATSIQTAAPTASIQCGALGTVSLATLLAAPFRTWVSGAQMVECHYRADVGGGTLLSAWFHVRLFADGRMWIRAICENGYLDNGSGAIAANADRNYVPTVSIGGSNVYTNGGASLAHYSNTRWSVEGWIGGNPSVTPLHDVAYLNTTKLVPNYGWRAPTSTAFTTFITQGAPQAWAAAYTPMAAGDTDGNMGSTGYGPFIGLLPLWNALYATSGDTRARTFTLSNSSALNSRPIVWRDRTTHLVPRPSDFPTWNYAAASGGGGADTLTTGGGLGWDQPHQPGEGYFAYMLTGDYWHYETMAMNAAMNYLIQSANRGNGTARLMRHTQVRGSAWMLRTVGLFAAIAPTGDNIAANYRAWLEQGGYAYFNSIGPAIVPGAAIGYLMTIGAPNGPLTNQPWMQHFWIGVNGLLWDIEPGFASTANHLAVRDYMYKAIVGILGPNGSSNHCYTAASLYDGLVISPNNYAPGGTDLGFVGVATDFSTSWGTVWQNTYGSANTSCGSTLGGSSGGVPTIPNGYWANLLPAISYAVDHSATGAQASWARLTAASNWSSLDNSGFDNTPLWGVQPRWVPPYAIPAVANTSTLIGTNTLNSVKPASHSQSQIYASVFGAWDGPTFVPIYSEAGAAVYACTGGHADPAMLGTALFDFEFGTWAYLPPGNGLTESPAPYAFPGAMANLTYAELLAATSGQYPAPPHPYGNRAYLAEGVKGSVVYIGRGSINTGGSDTTASIHKMDMNTREWVRAGNDVLAYKGLESSYVYDPTLNRYYAITSAMNSVSALAYWDPVTQTTGVTVSFTPMSAEGSSPYKRAFIDNDLRIMFYHYGPLLFGMNLNNIAGGWTNLSFSGTCPPSGNSWIRCNGAWWNKASKTDDNLIKFVPGATPLSGSGVFTSVAIGGGGLPDYFGTDANHQSALMAVPALGPDMLAWIANGNVNDVAIIKVA